MKIDPGKIITALLWLVVLLVIAALLSPLFGCTTVKVENCEVEAHTHVHYHHHRTPY